MLKMKVANGAEVEGINLRPILLYGSRAGEWLELQRVSCSARIAACTTHHTISFLEQAKFTRGYFTITESAECHSRLLQKWGARSAQDSRCFILTVSSRVSPEGTTQEPNAAAASAMVQEMKGSVSTVLCHTFI